MSYQYSNNLGLGSKSNHKTGKKFDNLPVFFEEKN